MARAELLLQAEACGPEASRVPHSAQAELRSAILAAASQVGFQVGFAARLLLAEREVPPAVLVPDVSLGESEVHLPRVESTAAGGLESDEPGALPLVVAMAAQVESDVQAQPVAPVVAEVPWLAEAAALGAQVEPPRAAVVARRVGEAVAAVQPDAVVLRPAVVERTAPDAAVAAQRVAARHAAVVLRPAEGRPAEPAVVQAADPSVAASACRRGRPRPALARRPAARSVHEMRHLQTASRREQSSQAAQDEVWS
jgi:hypothetical protein